MDFKIRLSPSVKGSNDLSYVGQSLEKNAFSPHEDFVFKLQKQFVDYFNDNSVGGECISVNSGTSALHVAMIQSNIKKGSVVLCQSSTFIATVNPILYQNATPIFIDSEESSWNMCPVLLERAILDCEKEGVKPKAIVVGCNYGMPCSYDQLIEISLKYKIPLIEDSAAALGSRYKNKPCGSFGEFSIFSLNSNKIITGASGGILHSRNEINVARVQELISQAKSNDEIGYNYQMNNVSAAIACSQFEELEWRVIRKRELYNQYFNQLSGCEKISFLMEPEHRFSNRWLTTVVFDSKDLRDLVLAELAANHIETRKLWEPLHLMNKFKKYKIYSNGVSERLFSNGLCLPSGISLTVEEQNGIIEIIKKILS